jgi:hypothetical protein
MTIPQRNVKYLHSLLELLHEVQNAEISCRKAAREIILANNKNAASKQKQPTRKSSLMKNGKKKVAKVMREYGKGKLKSSSGQKVKSQKQAIAIALSEAGMSKKKKGK